MLKYFAQRQLFRRHPWSRASSRVSSNFQRNPRQFRPREDLKLDENFATQFPAFETPSEALPGLRKVHGLTVHIRDLPLNALVGEVLDFVMGGPIFRVDDLVQNGKRTVSLTFFDTRDALAFYKDATSQEIDVFGRRPKFSWDKGTAPKWNGLLSRSIVLWDKGRLGTEEDILSYLSPFGPIDRVTLMKEKTADRAFINFLSAESGLWAASELRKTGAIVQLTKDRCSAAASNRAIAAKNQMRSVILRSIPPQTTLSELCGRIRGGLIHRMSYVPESGVAFVHFAEHSSAAYFVQHAVYRGINVHGRRLNVVFLADSEKLPEYLAQNIQLGATRCLAIEGVVNPDMLRADCTQYGHVERIVLSESTSTVSFTHIQHAIKASRMLPTKLGYEGLRITFVADPCAAPYPQDLRKAATLEAELSSLLIPSEVVNSGHLLDNTFRTA
ncbi:hypothetical protein MSAN_01405000 [Mycena sanguinolenta]|uniref:RRM domain-containing protein n=1 Tax=Mycena sanguinolenta TaxID=230812 RepID=A0A8H6YAQ2_9AGAR|nr:hypothetical protein MSAN_01405000 [Mycena sanguinolenta]